MFKTKKTYGIVAVMLAISLLLCSGCAVIDKSLGIEPKETWHATVDEHFVDNKVDVVMQKYASKKTYTPKDFKEVGCVEIKIRTTEEQINDGMKLAISVILDKHSKENVLEACQKLIKRRDVFSATPQYYAQTDLIPDDLGYSQFQSAMPHISLFVYTPYIEVGGEIFYNVSTIDKNLPKTEESA